jgi:sugar phosphate isomerase/epimerase
MKPLSIQLYTVREETKDGNHLPILQQIADIGYKGVEGSGYGMTNPEFRKVVEDMGMVVSSTWAPLATPENLQEVVDTAGELGTNHLVAGLWIQDQDSLAHLKESAEKVQQAASLLKPHGIDLSLHNHWMEFELYAPGKRPVDYFIEHAPDAFLELDIYWAAAFGLNDPAAEIRKFASRTKLLHVKDGPLVRNEPMEPVGGGVVDIPAALKAADPSVTAWHIVELDHYAGDMMHAVRESYRYLVGNGLSEGNKPV